MRNYDHYLQTTQEIGFVEEASHSIIYASGLPNAKINEIVMFENNQAGIVMSLSPEHVEILLLANTTIRVGMKVTRTGKKQQMLVGKEYLGKTIDPFGKTLDKLVLFRKPTAAYPIHTTPLNITRRKRIEEPFETGVAIVDFLVPLGKGQRELIIGDRKTGKTSFLHQTILNQAKQGTLCIYAAIGKKRIDIKKTEDFFKKSGIADRTILIASASEDPAGIIYLTPYCAMALAEYFRDEGNDVLVVLDDMLTHARFYREISLIAKRFPGRNSYPADIFYTHARLLERAGNFYVNDDKECSITCLPVVESVEGDIAGYIQTNLMSMTDGHIFFDVDAFANGVRPAINPFLSVSRVGRQTQSPLRLSIHREIISFLTLRQRMENFSHFGQEATAQVKNTLAVGERIMAFFSQNASEVIEVNLQIIIFGLLWHGVWTEIDTLQKEVKKIRESYNNNDEAKRVVREIIESSDNLNALLTNIRERTADLFKALNVGVEGKVTTADTEPAVQQTTVNQPVQNTGS